MPYMHCLDKEAKYVAVNFATCTPDMKRNMLQVLRGMNPESTKMIFKNANEYPFPVKAVDEYLRKNPERVQYVTELDWEFSPRHSVLVLEMVRKRFPNIRTLKLPHSFNHPIEHALREYSRMPHLRKLHFGFSVRQLAEYMKEYDYTPLTQVKSLLCCMVGNSDKYENFERSLPLMFPNLESLHYLCPDAEFTELLHENLRRLWPMIKFCKAIDASEITTREEDADPLSFPIKLSDATSAIAEIDLDDDDE